MTLKTEEIILNEERNVRLTAMTQALGGEFKEIHQRPGVLILPGGGYAMCSDREAEAIAYPFLFHGYHAFVLRYSVAEHKAWPNPLDDYEQAMEYMTQHSSAWGLMMDKIAVIGFSAGGHLAACAATVSVHRPAAAILGYPALSYSLVQAIQPDGKAPVPAEHVDGDTCPCFLMAARDDQIVPMDGMLDFQKAMTEAGIRYESHVYAYGDHGFGPGDASISGSHLCSRASRWMTDAMEWLDDTLGKMDATGMGEPACQPHMNGDWEDTLSVLCTLKHIRAQNVPMLQESMAVLDAMIGGSELAKTIYLGFNLQFLLAAQGKTPAEIADIDAQLHKIPNQKPKRNGYAP